MQYDFLGHPKSYPGWISFSIRIFYVDLSYFWIPHTILVCSADYQVTRPLRVFFLKKYLMVTKLPRLPGYQGIYDVPSPKLPSYHGYQVTRAYLMITRLPDYQVTRSLRFFF